MSTKYTGTEAKVYNDQFASQIEGGNVKEAAEASTGFVRMRLREESFAEKILTPQSISNDELDKAEDPEVLLKWFDREPDVTPAKSVPFGVAPDGFEFKGTRYPIYFRRIMTDRFRKDVDKLRGYDYDIRSVLFDLSTKEIATAVDNHFMDLVNSSIGTVNTANTLNGMGLPQNVTISGGITKDNLAEAFKVIQRLKVPFGPTQKDGGEKKGIILTNNTTAMDLLKFNALEVGNETVQTQWKDGLPNDSLLGVKPVYTIKSDLVKDGEVFLFTEESFLGKYMKLQDLTAYMKQDAFFLEFWQYMNVGMAIGNIRGMAKIAF